ncbi:tetratricopeptide repeat protein [Streptomyces sp. ME19-01-6]|uniref:tetratricopeptide repeat protein n=1 Tax=Streptomyces sp. ME19-01-6 TaxID=3028686 RepID=UPI0029AB30D8|nr:tetratricopeptide repeat protein [Streptomyces sp. ME19-01-6]MDX3224344.1 tetratricopeptide repeat protein [Streptomyces sp. ME19-01-6]
MDSADLEAARRDAGSFLRYYWEAAEFDTAEELADDEAGIRAAYDVIQAAVPDDATSSTCLTLLELGKLRAHLNDAFGTSEDHFAYEHNPPAGLAEDDQRGRELAAAVVRAAERTLALQGSSNLAAFSRACALHWLGERDAAAEAYREALRLDPYDDIARARIEQLEDVELAEPPGGLITHHPHGFHVLEMTHLVGHSGSTKGWVWLLSDPSAVRDAADGYLDAWLADHGHSLDDEFSVWTHVPGAKRQGSGLCEALRRTAEGQPFIDWSQVPLADPVPDPLPVGQPIRWLGQLHFSGGTEHDD